MTLKNVFAMAVGLMLLPFAFASADVENVFLTVDGRSNTTVEEGDNVMARTTFDRDGEHVESISWELVGSGLPETCVNIDDAVSSGGTSVRSFDIETEGATEGTWDVKLRFYGDGFYPNNTGASNLCEDEDEVNDSPFTFADRITILDNIDDNQDDDNDGNSNTCGTNSNTNCGNDNDVDEGSAISKDIQALIAAIKLLLAGQAGGGTGNVGHAQVCATLASYSDLNVGSRGVRVSALQAYLISKGGQIPAITSGAAAPGYFGAQTNAALWVVLGNHGCN